MEDNNADLEFGLTLYLDHLRKDYGSNGYVNKEFSYEVGRKYVHVIMSDNQRSSHSWIHPEDQVLYVKYIDALDLLIDYYGG